MSPRTKEIIALNEDKLTTLFSPRRSLRSFKITSLLGMDKQASTNTKTLELVVVIHVGGVGSSMLSHRMYKGNPKR